MLSNIFGKRKNKRETNPEVDELSRFLKKQSINFNICELYKIGETIYESTTLFERVKEEIKNKNLVYLLSLNDVDVMKDLIQIYLIVDENKNNMLLGIIDPYELYDNPSMIEYTLNIDFEPNLLKEKRIK